MKGKKNDVTNFVNNNQAHEMAMEKMRLEFSLKQEELQHRHGMELLSAMTPAFAAVFGLLQQGIAQDNAFRRERLSFDRETREMERESARELREQQEQRAAREEAAREERAAAEEARRNERHQCEMERIKR